MYTEDFFTHNIPMWETILKRYKDEKIEAIEIGCFEGRATVWLLENILTNPDSHITCIDPFTSKQELKDMKFNEVKNRFLENTKSFTNKVTLIQEYSSVYLKKREEKANLIYIDGSHVASDVSTDAILSHMILDTNGMIIFDDYLWCQLDKPWNAPKRAIDSFMDCFGTQYKVVSIGYQVILQKI